MRTCEVTPTPSTGDTATIEDGVFSHGRAVAADGNAQPLACLMREGDELIAGALGRTEYGRLFIHSVWVAESYRGAGIGSETIVRMEQEALGRGCSDALIETLLDRNARLYERLGYESIAVIPRYVGTFTRYIMVKTLQSSTGGY